MTRNDVDTGLWIRRFQPWDAAPSRVVCFPHAGGAASYFVPLSRALAGKSEVLAIQYPGRQDRRTEKGIDNIPELADAVTSVLRSSLDRPTVVFGHSMGATLGFEVVRRLERGGVFPTALVVSGRVGPTRTRDETAHLEDDDGLLAAVKALSGTDEKFFGDEELLRMILPALRIDYTAAETYRYTPGPLLRTPIHAHVGDSDPKATIDEVRDWANHTTGPFSLRTHPGGHFYLNTRAAELTQAIVDILDRAVETTDSGC
ncbi:thioesterase II family protein [Nocardia sp. CA-129566]|uniref:thioesterase II family protein n=1 Tax=Nocardia sp. CA-129566 TaxID=3239976 RepID=UPI003D960E6B